MTIPFN
jgi:hypothetical protein